MQKKSKQTKHKFEVCFKNAKQVNVCGDFNKWDVKSHPMKEKEGVWSLVLPLNPGRYEYKYIVDGIWHIDPKTEKSRNKFGTENSILIIS